MTVLRIIALASLLLIVGCASPAPEPLPTYTPSASLTPWPTYTPYPTFTPIPKPTSTALPTATITPPAVPTPEIPDGWKAYEALDGSFTLAYPASWEIASEGPRNVSLLSLADKLGFQARIVDQGAEGYSGTDEENIRLNSTVIAEVWGDVYGYTGFRVVDRGKWEGAAYLGYYTDYMVSVS